MGVIDDLLGALGIGGDEETTDEPETAPAQMTLETKVPKEDNAIWEHFESIEINLTGLTLHATDGSSKDLRVAGGFDLREEEQVDGDDAVYKLRAPAASYDSGDFEMNVRSYELQEDAPDLPLEGFEASTLAFDGQFEPNSGEEWILTVVLVARVNDDEDAYVLDTSLEWREA